MKTKIKLYSPPPVTLTSPAFFRLVSQGVIADGRAGGMLVGRSRELGGVAVIRQQAERFWLQPERLFLDDFILNPRASFEFVDRISAMLRGAAPRSRIGKKQKLVTDEEDAKGLGEMWTYTAIDPVSKVVPSFVVGKRTFTNTYKFGTDLASRMRNQIQIAFSRDHSATTSIQSPMHTGLTGVRPEVLGKRR